MRVARFRLQPESLFVQFVLHFFPDDYRDLFEKAEEQRKHEETGCGEENYLARYPGYWKNARETPNRRNDRGDKRDKSMP